MPYWRQPLDREHIRITHGIVRIIDDRCKGCGFCVTFCPSNLLAMSEGTNSKGYHIPIVVDNLHCTNCGLCALLCPDFAIYIEDGGTHAPEKVLPIEKREAE